MATDMLPSQGLREIAKAMRGFADQIGVEIDNPKARFLAGPLLRPVVRRDRQISAILNKIADHVADVETERSTAIASLKKAREHEGMLMSEIVAWLMEPTRRQAFEAELARYVYGR